jgi:hypothetical protein
MDPISAELVARVTTGLPRIEATSAFESACRRHDTLFITDRWFAPRKDMLLALLSDPICHPDACTACSCRGFQPAKG